MPRCTVCSHPKRSEIDGAIISSEAHRVVAKRFGISPAAVFRHQSDHLPAHLAKAKQVAEVVSASSLVDELLKLTRTTGGVLARALADKDGELALKAIARLEKQLELKGRLLGELEDRGGRTGETHIVVTYVDKMLVAPGGTVPNGPRAIEAAGEGNERYRVAPETGQGARGGHPGGVSGHPSEPDAS
jgi:hypothetical protein